MSAILNKRKCALCTTVVYTRQKTNQKLWKILYYQFNFKVVVHKIEIPTYYIDIYINFQALWTGHRDDVLVWSSKG